MPKEKEEEVEVRGPIIKTPKGWPVNPFGVLAIIVILALAAILLSLALKGKFAPKESPPKGVSSEFSFDKTPPTGRLIDPKAGAVIRSKKLIIKAEASDEGSGVAAVEFWFTPHVEKNWQRIARLESPPYNFDWDILGVGNKAVIITMHVIDKAGNVTKDPDGWHEGVILLPSL